MSTISIKDLVTPELQELSTQETKAVRGGYYGGYGVGTFASNWSYYSYTRLITPVSDFTRVISASGSTFRSIGW